MSSTVHVNGGIIHRGSANLGTATADAFLLSSVMSRMLPRLALELRHVSFFLNDTHLRRIRKRKKKQPKKPFQHKTFSLMLGMHHLG